MNKAFEKILERLILESSSCKVYKLIKPNVEDVAEFNAYKKCIEIVKEVAEEYNGGWVPCSKKLPEDDSVCIVTVEYPNNKTMVDYGWFDRKSVCWFVGMQEFRTSNILAWQPLPEPFKESD